MELYIKNMVCHRCKMVVKNMLMEMDYSVINIELGKAVLVGELNKTQIQEIEIALKEWGFELLSNENQIIITNIKKLIIQAVHEDDFLANRNLSEVISSNLQKEYSAVSKLFSELEGITIEKHFLKVKIERIKELLIYGELSISEIAIKMNYSSVAYLSNQFKKETGLTPSFFKQMKLKERKPLDEL